MATSLFVLQIKLISADRLKNVNRGRGKLLPYATLWINPTSKYYSLADPVNGSSPFWNQTLDPLLLPPGTAVEDAVLHVQLLHAASKGGIDPLIGSGQLRLGDLLKDSIGGGRANRQTLRLWRPSGRRQGTVDIELVVREMRDWVPPTANVVPPPPPPPTSSGQEEMAPELVYLSSDDDSKATEDPGKASRTSEEASETSSRDEDGDAVMIDLAYEDDGEDDNNDDLVAPYCPSKCPE